MANDKLDTMRNDDFDIEIFAIAVRFFSSLLMSAVVFLLLLVFVSSTEPRQFQIILTGAIFPLLPISVAVNILTGYITAKCASQAPLLHALIVAVLLMLFVLAAKQESPVLRDQPSYTALQQLLAIPLILIGARIAGPARNSSEGELLIRQWQESAERRKSRIDSAVPSVED